MVAHVGSESPVTELLQQWSAGDRDAAAEVLPLVYGELRRLAESHFRRERPGHTLQATAVVHEAYLRLRDAQGLHWESRSHFYALAAHLMRHILVDHARGRRRAKRGGRAARATLTEAAELAVGRPPDLIALDDALSALEAVDPRKAAVVELRFFAGLSLEESASCLGVSIETVSREWRKAKAWLHAELSTDEELRHGR